MEAIKGSAPAAGEAFATNLAFELLDTVAAAIADEGVEGGIGVAPIVTEGVRTSMASGAEVLMFAAPAFALWPGEHAGLVDVAPEWFRMRPATNGAVEGRARLEGPGAFGKNDGFIAERAPPLK